MQFYQANIRWSVMFRP